MNTLENGIDDRIIREEFERQVRLLRGEWSWYGPSYLRADDGRVMVLDLEAFRHIAAGQLTAAIAQAIDRQVKANCCSF